MTVPDPVSPAVVAFAAAGNDVDALSSAINEASYLDTQPGDDRQKLRGTNTFARFPMLSVYYCLEIASINQICRIHDNANNMRASNRVRITNLI